MNWIIKKQESLDQVNPATLLKINIFLGFFIALAHGLPLLLLEKNKIPTSLLIGYFTAPVALLAALFGIAALFKPSWVQSVLKAHTVFLLIMAAYMLNCSINIIVAGIPIGTSFSWNPLFFAFILAYPVYLTRRFIFTQKAMQLFAIKYSHVIVFMCSLLISAAIMTEMAKTF